MILSNLKKILQNTLPDVLRSFSNISKYLEFVYLQGCKMKVEVQLFPLIHIFFSQKEN